MISELRVMKSNAGFYLGRSEDGIPYSRQSGYYPTSDDANAALAIYPLVRRDCMENRGIYLVENQMDDPRGILVKEPPMIFD